MSTLLRISQCVDKIAKLLDLDENFREERENYLEEIVENVKDLTKRDKLWNKFQYRQDRKLLLRCLEEGLVNLEDYSNLLYENLLAERRGKEYSLSVSMFEKLLNLFTM